MQRGRRSYSPVQFPRDMPWELSPTLWDKGSGRREEGGHFKRRKVLDGYSRSQGQSEKQKAF